MQRTKVLKYYRKLKMSKGVNGQFERTYHLNKRVVIRTTLSNTKHQMTKVKDFRQNRIWIINTFLKLTNAS